MKNIIDEKGYFNIYRAENSPDNYELNFDEFIEWVKNYILPKFDYINGSITYFIYFAYDRENDGVILFPSFDSDYDTVVGNRIKPCRGAPVFSTFYPEKIFYENYGTSYYKNYYSTFNGICRSAKGIKEKLSCYRNNGALKYQSLDKNKTLLNTYKTVNKLYEDFLHGRVELSNEQIQNMYDSETLDNIAWRIGMETLYNEMKKELNMYFAFVDE